jgi:hypothetical protein
MVKTGNLVFQYGFSGYRGRKAPNEELVMSNEQLKMLGESRWLKELVAGG